MRLASSATVLFGLGVSACLSAGAWAQSGTQSAAVAAQEEIGAVFAFNRICYGQVPSTQGIRNMATQLGWQPLAGDELEPFRTGGAIDMIAGWDAQIGERVFRVGLTQGPIGGALLETFPDFADGQATSCTMVLDGLDPADTLYADTLALAGKEPASKDAASGGLLTTTWAGGNADVKVFLVLKTDMQRAGNLLNVVVLTKQANL